LFIYPRPNLKTIRIYDTGKKRRTTSSFNVSDMRTDLGPTGSHGDARQSRQKIERSTSKRKIEMDKIVTALRGEYPH